MASSVTLSSAAMSNLLALQNTQSLVDRTQNRLSTGKAVNSALDDAMAFFKNRNLTNRASDLSDIKSDIQNGVNVIKEAVDSLEQVDSLLKSAKAAAQSARAEKDAKVRENYIKQINDNLGQIVQLAGDTNYDGINLVQAVDNVDVNSDAGKAALNVVNADVRNQYAGDAFDKALKEKGADFFGTATPPDGTTLKIAANTDYGVADSDITKSGGGKYITSETKSATDLGEATLTAGKVYKSGDNYYLATDDTSAAKIDMAAVRDDFIKANATTLVADTDLTDPTKNALGADTYNTIRQTAVNDEVAANQDKYSDKQGFIAPERLTVIFSEQDKNRKIDVQARALGSILTGLVDGTKAKTVSAKDWVRTDGTVDTNKIDDFIATVDTARSQVRAYAAELGNYSSIMSIRKDWTDNTVNTLKGGAADLVNANMNEESANMLALQTRQQLGVIALSISQQSDQAVLRLF
ncbi:hypothetical protein IHV25_04630 [Phaeovibrio sulfidiphilus]|uniref:Flagellin n=1 Tax=Phaeovibrio sulfidiphilus TaxID=1220600 RepID=A0A8J7CPE2_9PROT|nr:flagellin [Phaeovibrio sulfidiphilus]MBE1236932.1 hypothetical protein [Phaeovibrio sulfidiphilus]